MDWEGKSIFIELLIVDNKVSQANYVNFESTYYIAHFMCISSNRCQMGVVILIKCYPKYMN